MGFWVVDRMLPGVTGGLVVAALTLAVHHFLNRKFLRRIISEITAAVRREPSGEVRE